MPAIRRTLKNVVKNYSDAQVKVREATSNDPWGPSSTLMSEIADFTYNVDAFNEIMPMIWKRLNDDGKNWRHVYKSLVLLDYIVKTGRDKVAQQCKENFHAIKTLTTFQYIDADNKDQGMNVREKAKQLVTMLSDDERLKNERAKALKAKERFAQNAMGVGNKSGGVKLRMNIRESPTHGSGYSDSLNHPDSSPEAELPSEMENARPSSAGEEELQLQLALAMSKEEHEEDVRKQKSDDIKLQMALEQSREQEKSKGGSLLILAAPTNASAGAQAASTDPWGAPLPSQPTPPPIDPWGAPLSQPASNPGPWGAGGGVDASGGSMATAPPPSQPAADPWGLPVASTSPTPAASSAFPPTSLDPFGAPATNGASASIVLDNEFDLLSARSNDSSPVKSSRGFEEFDALAGNGSSADAWDMNGLKDGLQDNKKKSAKDFLGANANLVNLDQLVSQAPPKDNNPFATKPEPSNPFQDPNANVRRPMAQMQATTHNQGFSQPAPSGSLLPAPLLPMGSNPPLQQQPPPPAQQSYNPFL